MEPTLRDMSMADVDAVLAIEQQIHAHPWTRGMFVDSLTSHYLCKVFELQDEMIGYVILMPALDEVHLLDIGIAKAHQGKGLGFKLFNIISVLCKNDKLSRMLLEVRRSNAAALALYRKAGCVEIGVRRDYYPALQGREDALVMECRCP